MYNVDTREYSNVYDLLPRGQSLKQHGHKGMTIKTTDVDFVREHLLLFLKSVCSFFPGYAFLLFQEETSVQALIDACIEEDGKLYLCVSSPTIKDKPVSHRRSVK